jgi:fumarate hydratase class II
MTDCISGLQPLADQAAATLARNPVLVTALNPEIGYEAAAAIAKRALREGRPVLDVALEDTDLPRETLARLLDPGPLARGEHGD